MGERWGTCIACKGHGLIQDKECIRCLGTGFDGSAEFYLREEQRKEDLNFPAIRSYAPYSGEKS